METNLTDDELMDLMDRYAFIFDKWLDGPDAILALAKGRNTATRAELAYLLERWWFKLKQDISATLILVRNHHFGSAKALVRICREAAIYMLNWSMCDPQLDRPHLKDLCSHRPPIGRWNVLISVASELTTFPSAKADPTELALRYGVS